MPPSVGSLPDSSLIAAAPVPLGTASGSADVCRTPIPPWFFSFSLTGLVTGDYSAPLPSGTSAIGSPLIGTTGILGSLPFAGMIFALQSCELASFAASLERTHSAVDLDNL